MVIGHWVQGPSGGCRPGPVVSEGPRGPQEQCHRVVNGEPHSCCPKSLGFFSGLSLSCTEGPGVVPQCLGPLGSTSTKGSHRLCLQPTE